MGGGDFFKAVIGIGLMFIPGMQPWAVALGRTLLVSAVMSAVNKPKQKGQSGGQSMSAQGRMETVRQPLSPRQIVYGRVRVGGTLSFFETTTDNQTALLIITLAGRKVKAIRDVYYNDHSTLDYGAAGATAGAATGKYAGYSNIYRSLGGEGASQPFQALVDRLLSWSAADLQRGCAKLHTTHLFSNEVWQTGLPAISAVIDGCDDIRDPRIGSPSTERWTNNPALIIADYLTYANGVGTLTTEIDEAALIAAANICDERVVLSGNRTTTLAQVQPTPDGLVLATGGPHFDWGDGVRFSPSSPGTLPGGLTEGVTYYVLPHFEGDTTIGQYIRVATSYANAIAGSYLDITSEGSGTITMTHYDEPRYRLNGAFDLGEAPQEVLQRMLSSMAGKLINSGGVWFIYAGAYIAPTLTFDEDDLAGSMDIQTGPSRSDSANAVKGTYVDPSEFFQPVDFPPVTSQTYFEEDGGVRVWRDVDFTPFVTSGTQAQRLAKIDLLNSRVGLSLSGQRFKLSAFRMMTGGNILMNNTQLGWSAKPFEVVSSSLVIEENGNMFVVASLKETAAEIFDWSVSDEQLATIAPNTNLPDPNTVSPPTALTFAQSTTLPDRGTLSWTAPSDSFVDKYQVEYQITNASFWTALPPTTDTTFNLEKLIPAKYSFRVKAINIFGASSSYATTSGDLFSAQAVANYSGELSGLGATREVFRNDIDDFDWVPFSAVIYSLTWCPANNKIYGAVAMYDSFSISPQPSSPEFEFERILRGRDLTDGCYVPSLKRMVFSQSNGVGSPSPGVIVGINPLDNSVAFESAYSVYNVTRVVYCPYEDTVWAMAQGNARILRYDPSDGTLLSTIDFSAYSGFARPKDAAYCPTTNEMWIGDYSNQEFFIVSLTGSPTHNWVRVTVGSGSPQGAVRGICYCPSIDRMVLALTNGSIAFYNPVTRAMTDWIPLGVVGHVFYVPSNDRLYAMSATVDDQFWTIVPSSKNYYRTEMSVAAAFTEGCFCPLNNFIYAANSEDEILVITS